MFIITFRSLKTLLHSRIKLPDWETVTAHRTRSVVTPLKEVKDDKGNFVGYRCNTDEVIERHFKRLLEMKDSQGSPIPPGEYTLEIKTGYGKQTSQLFNELRYPIVF